MRADNTQATEHHGSVVDEGRGEDTAHVGGDAVNVMDDIVVDHFVVCGLQQEFYVDLVDRVHAWCAKNRIHDMQTMGNTLQHNGDHVGPRSATLQHKDATLQGANGAYQGKRGHRRYHSDSATASFNPSIHITSPPSFNGNENSVPYSGTSTPVAGRVKLASIQDALSGMSHSSTPSSTPASGRGRSASEQRTGKARNRSQSHGWRLEGSSASVSPVGDVLRCPSSIEEEVELDGHDNDHAQSMCQQGDPEWLQDVEDDDSVEMQREPLHPIVDIVLVSPCHDEPIPVGYEIMAEIQHCTAFPLVSIHSQPMHVCYKRAPAPEIPISNIHVFPVPADRAQWGLPKGYQMLPCTVTGHPAYFILPASSSTRHILVFQRLDPASPSIMQPIYGLCGSAISKIKNDSRAFTIDPSFQAVNLLSPASPDAATGSTGFWVQRQPVVEYASLVATQPICHYPPDTATRVLPSSLSLFAHTLGVRCRLGAVGPSIGMSSFRLTNQTGTPIFATSLLYYDRYVYRPDGKEAEVWYVQRSLNLLSRFAFYPEFAKTLLSLHRLLQANDGLPLPVERYVLNIFEVPIPTPGMMKVNFSIPQFNASTEAKLRDTVITFTQPERDALPKERFPASSPFHFLSAYNVVYIVNLMLVESKIIFHAQEESVLNAVMECICQFLFPFRWQHIFLSSLPPALVDFLQAPVPFLIGMRTATYHEILQVEAAEASRHGSDTSSHHALRAPGGGPSRSSSAILPQSVSHDEAEGLIPKDCVIVDLDRNVVSALDGYPNLPNFTSFVQELGNVLATHQQQKEMVMSAAFNGKKEDMQSPTTSLEDISKDTNSIIRRAFLNYFLELLANYTDSLKAPNLNGGATTSTASLLSNIDGADPLSLFDRASFISNAHPMFRPFYQSFFETLIFSKFMEERTFVSDYDGWMVFFDEEMEQRSLHLGAESSEDSMVAKDIKTEKALKPPFMRSTNRYSPRLKAGKATKPRRQSYGTRRNVFVPSAYRKDIPKNALFIYDGFPELDSKWYYQPLRHLVVMNDGDMQNPSNSNLQSQNDVSLPPKPPPRRKSSAYYVANTMIDVPGDARDRSSTLPANSSLRRKYLSHKESGTTDSVSSLYTAMEENLFGGAISFADAARELFSSMIYTYFQLFTAYASRATPLVAMIALHQAMQLLSDLQPNSNGTYGGTYAQVEFFADADLYEWLLSICGRVGLRREAQIILQDMTSKGIRPNARAYAWIMEAATSVSPSFTLPSMTLTPARNAATPEATSAKEKGSMSWKKFRSLMTAARTHTKDHITERRRSLGREDNESRDLGTTSKLRRSKSFSREDRASAMDSLPSTQSAEKEGLSKDDDSFTTDAPNPFSQAMEEHQDFFSDQLDLSFVSLGPKCQCKKCNYVLSESDILAGWVIDHYTPYTFCPKCGSPAYPTLCLRISSKELRMEELVLLPAMFETPSTPDSVESYGDYVRHVPLMKPSALMDEFKMQITSRSNLWRSKKSMMKESPVLFWNFIWITSVISFPCQYTLPTEEELQQEPSPINDEEKGKKKPFLKKSSLLLTRFGNAFGSGWSSKLSIDTTKARSPDLAQVQSRRALSSQRLVFSENDLNAECASTTPAVAVAVNGVLRRLRGLPTQPATSIVDLRRRLFERRRRDMGLRVSLETIADGMKKRQVLQGLKAFLGCRSRFGNKGIYGEYFYGSAYEGLWMLPETSQAFTSECEFAKEYEKAIFGLENTLRRVFEKDLDRGPTASVLAIRNVFFHVSYSMK